MRRTVVIAILFFVCAPPLCAQTGTVTGTIVDARDGTPLEKVAVRVHDTKLTTLTTSDGRFQLGDRPSRAA